MSTIFDRHQAFSCFDVDLLALLAACKRSRHMQMFDLMDHEPNFEQLSSAELTFKVSFALGNDQSIAQALSEQIRRDLLPTEPTSTWFQIIENTFLLSALCLDEGLLPTRQPDDGSKFTLVPPSVENAPFRLLWESLYPWPIGFAPLIAVLVRCYFGAFASAGREPQPTTAVALSARTLPREVQARYMSLGLHRCGLVQVPPHLIDLAALVARDSLEANVEQLCGMGFSSDEAREMAEGGFLGVQAWLVSHLQYAVGVQTDSLDPGGLPLDEYNPKNPPDGLESSSPAELYRLELLVTPPPQERATRPPGVLVDRYYQSAFTARPPGRYALYGKSNDRYRDHFDQLVKEVPAVGTVRVKHYAVPIFEVGNLDMLQAISDLIAKEGPVFYRGQNRAYALSRSSAASRMLFGREEIVEPSLLSTASRREVDYETFHSVLQLLVQDAIYELHAGDDPLELEFIHSQLGKKMLDVNEWDVGVMALAQHYGVPTHGLDITTSMEVAAWFATHRFVSNDTDGATYRRIDVKKWPSDSAEWPVVYVVCPVNTSLMPSIRTIQPLRDFGVDALRPERQSAVFFTGSHGVHSNRLAEALACIVRLSPGEWATELSFADLFPNRREDIGYRVMLQIRERLLGTEFEAFAKDIVIYKDRWLRR